VLNVSRFFRKAFAPVAVLAFLLLSTIASPLLAQTVDCQSELDSSSGYTILDNGDSTSQTEGVVEWDGEVIKVHTDLPGVLTISATGDESQGSLYTEGSSSPHPLVDSATIGTSQGMITAVVDAGNHCIQLAPGEGASGDIEVEAAFQDVCHLGDVDDHGDSFLCATQITVGGSSASGEITSDTVEDSDVFTFFLESSATVTIASSGGEQVGGNLYSATGTPIDSDNTGWSGSNFEIVHALSPGRYYVRVTGPDESAYGLSVTAVP
jgi:hypothetical protein